MNKIIVDVKYDIKNLEEENFKTHDFDLIKYTFDYITLISQVEFEGMKYDDFASSLHVYKCKICEVVYMPIEGINLLSCTEVLIKRVLL